MLRVSFQARENPRKVLVIDAENDQGRTAIKILVSFCGHGLLGKQFMFHVFE